MTPMRTQRTKRILATRRQSERWKVDTGSSRDSPCQREIVAYNFPSAHDYWYELFVAVDRSRGEVRVPGVAERDAGKCDKWKYGGAAHSRFAGQELVRICNHKFV